MGNNHEFTSRFAVDAYSSTRELWDVPIFESKSFVALPTVGALVEGWILVVPRKPALSMATLPASLFSQLEQFLDGIVPIIEAEYGLVTMFEHGPSTKAQPIGCGVDYAHLHLVPCAKDLFTDVAITAKNIRWTELENLADIREQTKYLDGYWLLQQSYKKGPLYAGVCTDGTPVSQLFRRAIAHALGTPELYDWKAFLGKELIISTIDRFSKQVIQHERASNAS